jgi:hypothetical protein
MPFIIMEKPALNLKDMENNRKMGPQLFEFSVSISIATYNNIGVKRRLKVVYQHFEVSYFHFAYLGWNDEIGRAHV